MDRARQRPVIEDQSQSNSNGAVGIDNGRVSRRISDDVDSVVAWDGWAWDAVSLAGCSPFDYYPGAPVPGDPPVSAQARDHIGDGTDERLVILIPSPSGSGSKSHQKKESTQVRKATSMSIKKLQWNPGCFQNRTTRARASPTPGVVHVGRQIHGAS